MKTALNSGTLVIGTLFFLGGCLCLQHSHSTSVPSIVTDSELYGTSLESDSGANGMIHPENRQSSCSSNNNTEETTLGRDYGKIPVPDPSIVGYPVSRHSPDRRQVDPVNTIRREHDKGRNNPLGVSASEWKARTELAAAHRALYLAGLGSDQAAQCLMLRVYDPQHRYHHDNNNDKDTKNNPISFLMADWGVWFEEVTASNLLQFTVDGEQIIPPNSSTATNTRTIPSNSLRTNTGCIPVAKAIFESRPDVSMIVHIHPPAVMAVGGLHYGLLPLSQAAFFLFGQVSREAYDFTYETDFETNLARGFANGERAMLLNHHGMYAVGRDVAEALFVATHLTQACEVQVRTLSMVGGDLTQVILPSGDNLSFQYKEMMDSTDYSYDGSREWPGVVRKVLREAPDFNT